jgi:programmed cell death protein 5
MLSQILTFEARDRLHRISIVKPDRARYLEDSLIQAVRGGQLRGGSGPGGKINEADLIGMLEELGEQEEKRKTKIVFQRRRGDFSDDEDF